MAALYAEQEVDVEVVDATKQDEFKLGTGEVVNASGHTQELERNFGFFSVASVGIVTGSSWPAIGGSIVVNLYNGGPPGVIYELIVVTVFYALIAASLAELGSAIPSSAGVYHFASVTSGRYASPVAFLAGWWNFFAWIFGACSMAAIQGNVIISMWALFHPAYHFQRWHVYMVYLIQTWVCSSVVMFGNRFLPHVSQAGCAFIVAGVFITVLVCAIMPGQTGTGYASNSTVWTDWTNETGWGSNGFVFLAGMLNGAFSVGTPDVVVHMSEEIPYASRNIPRAIGTQVLVGFVTAFIYLVALFYSVSDLDAVINTTYSFPLAEVYLQATNTRGGALGLLIVLFIPIFCTNIGAYITAGRMLWTLARDNATPLSTQIGRVSPKFHNPFNATFACACTASVLGAIYVGSSTAFNALVGSFVILSTCSYFAAIFPHLITARRHVKPGIFWMPKAWAFSVHVVSCAYILAFIVIFCFPYELPVTAQNMNYSCLITGGLTLCVGVLYLWKRKHGYKGPRVLAAADVSVVSDLLP